MRYKLILILCSFILFGVVDGSITISKNSFDENMVVQPQFLWANHTCTQQGTGSIIRAPNGLMIGLTSAHFINFCGPQLIEVQWLDVKTGKPIARSLKSYGMPGYEGSYDPLDLRSDYFLLVVEGNLESQRVFELDNRSAVEVGERIWFPDKNVTANSGNRLIGGTLSKTSAEYLLVTLDESIDLQSRSGTPIISQHTGKVIGILVGGDKENKKLLYIAPGLSILKTLIEVQQCFLLRDVVGQ